MIKVFIKEEFDKIKKIQISGHADFAEYGKDLVCAGVSSIGIGLLNALDEYSNENVCLKLENGFIEIVVNDLNDEVTQLILNVGVIQLKTVEEQYSKFIKIKKEV